MRGFTLLEILIVLVIFGLIMVGLTSGLHFAGRAWTTQQRAIDRAEDTDAVRNTMREIIGSSRSLIGSAVALKVEAPLPRALGRAGVFDIEINAVNDQLVLTWQPHAKNVDPNDEGRATLLDGVAGFTLSYFIPGDRDAGAWGSSIALPKRPELVRIDLDLGKDRVWSPLVVAVNIEDMSAK
jgi:prepilin-type N-terminal cleavage/methylation domain-containing protein